MELTHAFARQSGTGLAMMANRRPNELVLDVDGVVLDLVTPVLAWVERKWPGSRPRPQDLVHYGFGESFGFPSDMDQVALASAWASDIKPYAGVDRLFKLGLFDVLYDTVTLATVRPQGAPHSSLLRSLHEHLAYYVEDGRRLETFESLAEKIRWLSGIHVPFDYVDDNLGVVRQLTPPEGSRLFLMDRPWNQSRDLYVPYRRIYSLEEIL